MTLSSPRREPSCRSSWLQTLVNAILLLVVAFIGGTLGLRRFEAIERSIAELRTELKSDVAAFRTEMKSDTRGAPSRTGTDALGPDPRGPGGRRAEVARLHLTRRPVRMVRFGGC